MARRLSLLNSRPLAVPLPEIHIDTNDQQASELIVHKAACEKFLQDAADLYERVYEELLDSNEVLAQRNAELAVERTMNDRHLDSIKKLRDDAYEGQRQLDLIRTQVASHERECRNLVNSEEASILFGSSVSADRTPLPVDPIFSTLDMPQTPLPLTIVPPPDLYGEQPCFHSTSYPSLTEDQDEPDNLVRDLFIWDASANSFSHTTSQRIRHWQVNPSVVDDTHSRSVFFCGPNDVGMTNWNDSTLQVQDLVFGDTVYRTISSWEQLATWLECVKFIGHCDPGSVRRLRCLYGGPEGDKVDAIAAALRIELPL